jgi:hypothetical protein
MHRSLFQLIGRAAAACAVASMTLAGVVRAEPQTELINPFPVLRTVSVADAQVVLEPAAGSLPASFVITL